MKKYLLITVTNIEMGNPQDITGSPEPSLFQRLNETPPNFLYLMASQSPFWLYVTLKR